MLEAIIIVVTLAIDQLSKYFTDIYLAPLGTSVPVWEGVFHFTSVHNTGAAFGMLSGAKWFFIIITVLTCCILLWLLIYKRSVFHRLARVCLALIVAGAIGNLIDRIWLGYVRDMLDFCLIDFAVFNVADSAVCVGAVIFLIDVLFFPKGKKLLSDFFADEKPKKNPETLLLENQEALSSEETVPEQSDIEPPSEAD